MELFSEETRRNPYPLYDLLRATSPVLRVEQLGAWVLFGYDAVKRALHDSATFSSEVGAVRPEKFEWLLFMDPPRHTALRGIVSRAFTSRAIASLEPRIRELSRSLLEGRTELDIVADYATPLPMMVIAEMLGLPVEDWPRYARWSESIVNLGNAISGHGADAASRAFEDTDREMKDTLARELSDQRGDSLLRALVGAGLSTPDLVRFVQLLLAAGTETTTNTIANAMLCFAEHPDARGGDVECTVEEVLRFRSPVQTMFRATTRPVEVEGITIPAKQFVMISLGSANRDPRMFVDPHRFDVARDPNPHIAFGHGIHFCLGAPLARLEARIALADLAPFDAVTTTWTPRTAFHILGPQALRIRRR